MVLPNATELRKLSEEAIEARHREWIESIKQEVIDDAKMGYQQTRVNYVSDNDEKEIRDIFEPLGYKVEFFVDWNDNNYINIMW